MARSLIGVSSSDYPTSLVTCYSLYFIFLMLAKDLFLFFYDLHLVDGFLFDFVSSYNSDLVVYCYA